MTTRFSLKKLFTALFIVAGLLSFVATTQKVDAAVTNTTPEAKVSFTFDDGPLSNYSTVAPILAKYGYSGTAYITTNCVGKTTVPNNCPADSNVPYMTWAQIKALRDTYGWEIGAHSVSHPLMSEINASRLEREVANSKSALQAQGINATSFATPYGDYNNNVLAAIAKYYTSHRPFHDTGYNTWPYDNYRLRVQQVQMGVPVETVKSYIDQAAASNTWLILVFHEVTPTPNTDPEEYQYSSADLDTIAAYVKAKNVKVSNISNGLVSGASADNLISNPSTGTSLGGGWTTDAPTNVKIDTTSKGAAPESTRSVKVTSSTTKTVHLYTPTISVNPNSQYVVKGYVSLATLNIGEVGFYIDEYDANGNWISGQYKQTISQWYVKDLSFMYTASSTLVAKARLQIIVTAANGATIYLDNIQWLTTIVGSTPPPAPQPVNLLTNGTFEGGLTGWTTDAPSMITLNTDGNGGITKQNSVYVSSSTSKNNHLFASPVTVSSSKNYTISSYVKLLANNDELGFYIDEYDANGNWISGKYVYGYRSTGSQTISFAYTPSSNLVTSASLQVIVPINSGMSGYIDDISWVTT